MGGSLSPDDDDLDAHIEDIAGLKVSLITVGCPGECADLTVVVGGGHGPYQVRWDDGSTDASRRVCPELTDELEVSVTDTPIESDEFQYEAQTVTASVTAEVFACEDGGMLDVPGDPEDPLELCQAGTTPPFLLIDSAPSLITTDYAAMNGTLPEYTSGGVSPTIVGHWRRRVDIGSCTKLLLAADAAGTLPIGFDNYMIFELNVPGSEPQRWYYGTAVDLTHVPTGATLPLPMPPTVSGFVLDPLVPNPAPFGYEARAIDLLANVPAGQRELNLSLYVLDDGGFGSTTPIWVLPE
jgi:hypothetical protein